MQKLITFGEVMLRLSPPGFQRFSQAESFEVTYGGGEANVAIALSQLGMSASHVTCFPDNDFGYAATSYLRKLGVETDHIVFNGQRIGIYYLEKGSSLRASRVVYDRAYSAFDLLQLEFFDWREILANASWFHWTGITPAISQSAATTCLEAIKTARQMGITVSGDITFRKNLWQYGKTVQEVMPDFVANSDVVICGESEANEVFGISSDTFESMCKALKIKFPALKKIISTKRQTIHATHNKLGGQIWNGEKVLQAKEYDITPIVDRVGGGDAFMGGFIYASLNGMNDQECIHFATAASVLKHTIPGDANLATLSEIKQLIEGESVGRLVR